MQREGGVHQLERRAQRDTAARVALDRGGAEHQPPVAARHDVERVARMQQAHRTREADLGAVQHRHLAAHAAQLRQKIPRREPATVEDRTRQACRRVGLDPDPLRPPAARPAPRAPRAGRDAPPAGNAARGRSARRDRARARRRPVRPAVLCPRVRRAKRSISPRSRPGAIDEGAGPRDRRAMRLPPVRRLLAETHDRLLGRLALAEGREHAPGPPGTAMRPRRPGRVVQRDADTALGQLRGEAQPRDPRTQDMRLSHAQTPWK